MHSLREGTADGLTDRTFGATVGLLFAVVLAFPVFQFVVTDGALFYSNAFDETTYLSYPISRAVQGPTRLAQYLVTAAHHLGLSGGWQNLLLDVGCLATVIAAVRSTFRLAGYKPQIANISALLVALLPVSVNGSNPVVERLFYRNLSSGLIYWISIPEGAFLPLMRSPEPQLSLALLSVAVWLSVKYRSSLLLLAIVPFLYYFIQIPLAIAATTFFVTSRYAIPPNWRSWAVAGAIFTIVSLGCWFVASALLGDRVSSLLVETRLPVLSFTGSICVVLLVILWRLEGRLTIRRLALAVAASCVATQNTQVISGFLAQPNNFEQSYGIVCVAIIGTLILASAKCPPFVRYTALTLSVLAFARTTLIVERLNWQVHQSIMATPGLLAALRTDAPRVAFPSVRAADAANLVFPLQPATALSFATTDISISQATFPRYLRTRRELLSEPATADRYREIIGVLDKGFLYGSADFFLLHIGRKREFVERFNVQRLAPTSGPPPDGHSPSLILPD